jgi:hypothetical protein
VDSVEVSFPDKQDRGEKERRESIIDVDSARYLLDCKPSIRGTEFF